MVEPVSVMFGIGASGVSILAGMGLYLAGKVRGTDPDHVVDMNEVSNYYRHKSANAALNQDIDDDG